MTAIYPWIHQSEDAGMAFSPTEYFLAREPITHNSYRGALNISYLTDLLLLRLVGAVGAHSHSRRSA